MESLGAITQVSIVERWAWWQAAISDPSKIGTPALPVHPGEYELGYYRTRRKGGEWEPVGIYPDESGLVTAWRGGKQVHDIPELFVWACRHPITYEAYKKAIDGGGFDDEPPAPIGHNSNASDDPFEALRLEYLGEKELAEAFMKKPITTQAEADQAGIWAKKLTAIKTKAEALHKVEKQPWLDGSRAVDNKFRELKEAPDELAKALKRHVQPYLLELKREEEERQRKAREEADRARREAEEAQKRAAEAAAQGNVASELQHQAEAEADRLAQEARAAEREAEARKVSAGRTGQSVGLRREKIGVVTDYAKAAAALVAMRHKDMIALIEQLAQRAAKAGMPLDGVEVQEVEKVV